MVVLKTFLGFLSILAAVTQQANAYPKVDRTLRERAVVSGRLVASSPQKGHLPKIQMYYADGKAYFNMPPENATVSYPLRCSVNEINSKLECIDDNTGAPNPKTGVVAIWIGIPLGHCCGSFYQYVRLTNTDKVANESGNSVGYASFGIVDGQVGLRFGPDYNLFAQWWSTVDQPSARWLLGWRAGPANDTLSEGDPMQLHLA